MKQNYIRHPRAVGLACRYQLLCGSTYSYYDDIIRNDSYFVDNIRYSASVGGTHGYQR